MTEMSIVTQRQEALRRANHVRVERARIKDQVRYGECDGLDLIAAPPAVLATMKVVDLLLVMPGIGRTKATRILALARVSPVKTLGGLTERQRRELLELVPKRGVRP